MCIIALAAVLMVGACACGFIEMQDVHLHFVVDGAPYRDMTVSAYIAGGLDVGENPGYQFDGWYTDSQYTHSADPAKATAEVTLYGRWVKEKAKTVCYTVTFLAEDGSKLSSMEAASLEDIVYPEAPELEGYVFVEWVGRPAVLKENVTLIASYRRLYRVVFVDDAGNVLDTQNVKDGDYATPPLPPVKSSTAQSHYIFTGWESDQGDYNRVHCDMTVYATFRAEDNLYTYILHTDNGAEEKPVTVAYGTEITLRSPVKAPFEAVAYTFVGWDVNGDGEPDNVGTRFRIYTDFEAWAIYAESQRTFAVTYRVDGNDTRVRVPYSEGSTYPLPDPTRAATAQYSYTFGGWDTDRDGVADDGLSAVYGDIVAVAVFDSTVNRYQYSFEDTDGRVYASAENVPYGTEILPPDVTPEKEATDSFSFTFSAWQDYEAGMTLTEDMRFVAVFDMQVRLYTITFFYKEKLREYRVSYGTVIDYDENIKPYPYPTTDEKAYAYWWDDWYPDYVVTKDFKFNLTKSASYDHVVQWRITEDDVLLTYYRTGDVLALPAEPMREGYEFVGWQDYSADIRVQDDMTMTAMWRAVE